MDVTSEMFVAPHADAVRRAETLSTGAQPVQEIDHVVVPDLTDMEIEVLGEIAARAVHVDGIAFELDLVDVEREDLLAVPGDVVAVLTELSSLEPEERVDIAKAWAKSEAMDSDESVTGPLLEKIIVLATKAFEEELDLYLWVA